MSSDDVTVMPKKSTREDKITLSREIQEDLRTIYSEGRADLRSFRDTFYQIIGILLAGTVAVAGAGFEYIPILRWFVPPILAAVIMTSVGYLIWRGELIKSLANIEKLLEIPEECAFERQTRKKGGGRMPAFFKEPMFRTSVAISFLMILVFELLILAFSP